MKLTETISWSSWTRI